MLRKFSRLIFGIYSLCMFVGYPLYLENGHYMITDGKYHMYQKLHVVFFTCMVIWCLLFVISKKCVNRELKIWEKFLIFWIAILCVSTYLNRNSSSALLGIQDWYMGFFMLLSFVGLFVSFCYFCQFRLIYFHMIATASFLVCLLGVLQRFDISPISVEGFQVGTNCLSTIGNINWICDYLSITMMICIYLFVTQSGWLRLWYGLSLVIHYGFLSIQGGESGWLIIGFSLILTYVIFHLKEASDFRIFYSLGILACGSIVITSQLYRIAIMLETTKMYDEFHNWGCSWVWIGLFLYFVIRLSMVSFHKKKTSGNRRIGKAIILIVAFICCMTSVFLLLHGMNPNVFSFMDSYELLDFDWDWGHDRGGNWRVAFLAFRNGGIWNQLFGAGPDGFYGAVQRFALYESAKAYEFLTMRPMLTNAHNVIFTQLVNFGVLGVVAYYGFFACCMKDLYKSATRNELCYWVMAILILCFIHDLVSFQQIVATPFVFILCGMGMSICRTLSYGKD